MIRIWILFALFVIGIVWAIMTFIKKHKAGKVYLPSSRFAAPVKLNETWSQLYETDSLEEINSIRMRLGEEALTFIVFEQGKRSLDGSTPKKFGIVVPKGHLVRGQTILTKALN